MTRSGVTSKDELADLLWHDNSRMTASGRVSLSSVGIKLTFLYTEYFILALVVKLHTFGDLFQLHMNIYLISYQPSINVHFVYVVLLCNIRLHFCV